MTTPILLLLVRDGGNSLEINASSDVEHYEDSTVKSELKAIIGEMTGYIGGESLEIFLDKDGTAECFAGFESCPTFTPSSNIAKHIISQALQMAKDKGYTLGSPTDNPRLHDDIFDDEAGEREAQIVYGSC